MNKLLKDLTTLNIGGPAKDVKIFKTENQLISILNGLTITKFDPFMVIGGGSNILVSDEGYKGTILKNEMKGIKREKNTLIVKSGTLLQDLVDFSIKEGLEGLQKLTGIPGTVGGAIYGNAGAYGQTISDHLSKLTALNPKYFDLSEFTIDECQFSYRDSSFKKNKFIILETAFELIPENSGKLKKEASEILKKRLIKYPKGIKCPGSFFKNIIAASLPKDILEKIPKDKIMYGKIPAGALLEEVGAKQDSLGDIKIASYHANLFINTGKGTSEDFYALAKKYHDLIKRKYGISLEPEVQLINLPPLNQ